MPYRNKRQCNYPGCYELTTKSYCYKHEQRRDSEYQRTRLNAAQRGYTWAWHKARTRYLQEHPICVICEQSKHIEPATEVDHIIPHKQDEQLFWNEDNWQALCSKCHKTKSLREAETGNIYKPEYIRPTTIPTFIVCGPPGSGKSTHVKKRMHPGDIVIDLDDIKAELSGDPIYQSDDKWIRPAINERNKRIMRLSEYPSNPEDKTAWLIISLPKGDDREWWHEKLKAQSVTVLLKDEYECIRNIENDIRRLGHEGRFINAVKKWWREYTPSDIDEIIM
ncbi:MAG: HNH endonuclease [Patescibacteria group bacterium]